VFPSKNVLSAAKLWFTTEIELPTVNQCSLPKVCILQRICDSLLKLSCLLRISIRCWKCVGCSKLTFAAESVLFVANRGFAVEDELFAANQCSLLKLCVLQQICYLLLKLSCLLWINIRCQKCVVCSESALLLKGWCLQQNCDSLPKLRNL
jgi:hypothetical protein